MGHLREKTKELQAEGRIGQKPYFTLKREAGLSEEQSTALKAIALAGSPYTPPDRVDLAFMYYWATRTFVKVDNKTDIPDLTYEYP